MEKRRPARKPKQIRLIYWLLIAGLVFALAVAAGALLPSVIG
jgi:hypothetical protein